MKTTEFIPVHDPEEWENCHGGTGRFLCGNILAGMSPEGFQSIKFIHNNLIPPGTSFGEHEHQGEGFEEWYYCLEGCGIMYLDGAEHIMRPGDIAVCRSGGSHGIINNSGKDMRIMVICAIG